MKSIDWYWQRINPKKKIQADSTLKKSTLDCKWRLEKKTRGIQMSRPADGNILPTEYKLGSTLRPCTSAAMHHLGIQSKITLWVGVCVCVCGGVKLLSSCWQGCWIDAMNLKSWSCHSNTLCDHYHKDIYGCTPLFIHKSEWKCVQK